MGPLVSLILFIRLYLICQHIGSKMTIMLCDLYLSYNKEMETEIVFLKLTYEFECINICILVCGPVVLLYVLD